MFFREDEPAAAADSVSEHVSAISGVRTQRGVPGQLAPGQATGGGVTDPTHRAGEPRAGEGHGVGQLARGAHVAQLPRRARSVLQRLPRRVGATRLQERPPAAPGASVASRCHAALAW